ncbi:hypothetical protein HZS_1072 [Henneguya salminicola]|nr:hypothetical protein HZS_1072 [Henneguya salminicola]
MAFRKNSGLIGLYKMMEEQTLIISDENKVEENIENEQPEVEEVKTADPLINIPPEKEFTNSTVLSSKESQQEKFTHELRFLIMNSYAGALIGRGGERIKALHEKYDVHLSIPMTHTSLRVGILTGKKTPILNSLQEIIPILKKVSLSVLKVQPPIESFEGKDHQINFVVPDTFAPIIIGTGGSRISSLRKNKTSKKVFHFESSKFSTEDLLYLCRDKPHRRSSRPTDDHHPGRNVRRPSHSPFKPPYMSPTNRIDMPTTTTQVSIPSKYVGAILGASGSNIRRIRMMSKCKVDLEDSVTGSSLRIVTLIGSEKQINDAEFYMQECIKGEEKRLRQRY